MIERRSFIRGLGALLCAPAIVRVSSLMPVSVFESWEIIPLSYKNPYIHLITREAVSLFQKNNEFLIRWAA